MSQTLGTTLQKVVVGILIGLLVVAFAIWGVNDVFSPQTQNLALSIGDEDIDLEAFSTRFRNELQNNPQPDGTQMSSEQAYQAGLHNQVLAQLMIDTLLKLDADELGLGVHNRTVRNTIEDMNVFHNEVTGQFSQEKMQSLLQQNNLSQADFEQDVYNSLRNSQLIPMIINGIALPAEFAERYYMFIMEKRKADVLTLGEQVIPDQEEPENSALQDYMRTHIHRYTDSEYRRISLLHLEKADIIPDIKISEERIKTAYDYQVELGELGTLETRSLVQLSLSDKTQAKAIAHRLTNGENADAIATELSLIEPITYSDVRPEGIIDSSVAEQAFTMTEGQADAIQSHLGFWYAIRIDKITPANIPDFESQKSTLRQTLLDSLAADKLYELTGIIEDALFIGSSLEEIAAQADVSYSSLDFINQTAHTPDNLHFEALAADTVIMQEIFALTAGEQSELFETSTGGWALLRVDEIKSAVQKDFTDIRNEVLADWQAMQKNEALNNLMIDIVTQAQAGTSLTELSEKYPDVTLENITVERSQRNENIGSILTAALFEANIGDIKRGPGPDNLTRQVAQLIEIIPNTEELSEDELASLNNQLAQILQADIQAAYQADMLKHFPMREYSDNIRQSLGINQPTSP